jgi:hypothetical protein
VSGTPAGALIVQKAFNLGQPVVSAGQCPIALPIGTNPPSRVALPLLCWPHHVVCGGQSVNEYLLNRPAAEFTPRESEEKKKT